MTEEEIAELTDLWAMLTGALDYHNRKWYFKAEGADDWRELKFTELHDTLYELGIGDKPHFEPIFEDGMVVGSRLIPDSDREKIIKQFIYRDQEAHARPTEEVKRAQLRFGFGG